MGNQQLGPKGPRRVPQDLEIALLQDLQRRAASDVSDPTNEAQVTDLLKRFWAAVHKPDVKFVTKGKEWQSMGFQGQDPITDFRAGGLLALENIVFFVEKYTEIATKMIRRREMKMSKDGTFMQNYPWSAAGVNVTHTVLGLFGLSSRQKLLKSSDLKNKQKRFWELVLYFNEVYCVSFNLLDDKYSEMKATYLSFNKVLDATKEELNTLLKHTGVQDIFKNEQQPLSLFLRERRRTSGANIGSQSRSVTPDPPTIDDQPGIGRYDAQGKLMRPTKEIMQTLFSIHKSIMKGRKMVKLPVEYPEVKSQSVSSLVTTSSPPKLEDKAKSPKFSGSRSSVRATNPMAVPADKPLPPAPRKEKADNGLPCRVARALYDFKAQAKGDLNLAEGDTVIVTKSDDSGWWVGESKSGEGRFPSNYIEEFRSAFFVAIAEYESTTASELTLKEGDKIKLTEVDASGWWKGTIQNKSNKSGWFPAVFVDPDVPSEKSPDGDPDASKKPTETTDNSNSNKTGEIVASGTSNTKNELEANEAWSTGRHGRAETLAEFGCDD